MVKTKVTTFHELQVPGSGKTFSFVPLDNQKDSLEYKTVANAIKKELSKYGFIYTDDKQTADIFIVFNYAIGDGSTSVGSIPIFGNTGGGTTYSSGSVYGSGGYGSYSGTTYTTPTFGVVGSQAYSRTAYPRTFFISMIDANKSTKDNIATVYEARALSKGSSDEVIVVLPSMIAAVFEEFPGTSGETESYTTSIKSWEDLEKEGNSYRAE